MQSSRCKNADQAIFKNRESEFSSRHGQLFSWTNIKTVLALAKGNTSKL